MKNKDLDNLFLQLRQGDKNAFGRIYDRLFIGVLNYTLEYVDSRQEAEDIVAESFLKVWKAHREFTTLEQMISFLYTTSKNAGIDRRRHIKMKYAKREEIVTTLLREQIDVKITDSITEGLLNRIYQAIEMLPEKSAAVIRMAFIEGLKNVEIAQRLGTSEKTVRNQKMAAIKRLRLIILNHIIK